MDEVTKDKINSLAWMFYKMQGYEVGKGYDFQEASHPQERSCWNQAIVAHAFYTGEDYLQEQR